MNISAVNSLNCTPIRPRQSFKGIDPENYENILKSTNDLNEEFKNNSDVKKPLAAVASVFLAGLLAFVSGKKIAGVVSHIFKKAPEMLENGVNKASEAIKGLSNKLSTADADKKVLGKIKVGKLSHFAGNAIDKTEAFLNKLYTKAVNVGMPENADKATKAAKVMENLFGWGAVATIVPSVCSKDANGDGVKDILQIGQNAYTGTQTKCSRAVNSTSKIVELLELVS